MHLATKFSEKTYNWLGQKVKSWYIDLTPDYLKKNDFFEKIVDSN